MLIFTAEIHSATPATSIIVLAFSSLQVTSNKKFKIKCDLLRNSNRQARLIEAFHLRESSTCSKIQRVCYSLQEGPLN